MSHLNLTVPETIEKLFFSLALRLNDPALNVRDYISSALVDSGEV